MQQATQAVPAHSPFAHLAADHQGAAAAAGWMSAQFRSQQAWLLWHHAQNHPVAVMTATGSMQPVEATVPPQAHGGWKCHQLWRCRMSSGFSRSDGQAGPSPLATGADHATSGMGTHAYPETGNTLPLAAGSTQSALRHDSCLASGRSELKNLSVSPYRSASCRRNRTWAHRQGPGSGR